MNNEQQRMVSGAAIGGTLAGPIGAGIGAGFGYLASISDNQPQPSTFLSN